MQTHLQPPPSHSSIRSAQLPRLMGLDLRRVPPFFRHSPSLHCSFPLFTLPRLLSLQTSSLTRWRLHHQQPIRSFSDTHTLKNTPKVTVTTWPQPVDRRELWVMSILIQTKRLKNYSEITLKITCPGFFKIIFSRYSFLHWNAKKEEKCVKVLAGAYTTLKSSSFTLFIWSITWYSHKKYRRSRSPASASLAPSLS